jgi:hypothetical protein
VYCNDVLELRKRQTESSSYGCSRSELHLWRLATLQNRLTSELLVVSRVSMQPFIPVLALDVANMINCLYETRPLWELRINLLKHTGYGMYKQVEYFNNCTLCSHCVYEFCICLRTNSDLCHLHKRTYWFFEPRCKVFTARYGLGL